MLGGPSRRRIPRGLTAVGAFPIILALSQGGVAWGGTQGARGPAATRLQNQVGAAPLLAGRLLAPSGQTLGGRTVTVDLLSNDSAYAAASEGALLPETRLATTTSDTQGNFLVKANPAGLPLATMNTDGTYKLLVRSINAQGSGGYEVRVAPPSGPGPWRVVGAPSSAEADPIGTRASASRLSAPAGKLASLELVVEQPTGRAGGSSAPILPDGGQSVSCGSGSGYWEMTNQFEQRDARVQRVSTKAKTTVVYNWSRTNESRVEGALKFGSGGWVSAGMLSVESQSGGANLYMGTNAYRDMTVAWEIRVYAEKCFNPSTGLYYYSGNQQARPRVWTGGTGLVVPDSRDYYCDQVHIITFTGDIWVSRYNAMTYGAGITFLGLNWKTSQTNSTYEQIHYKVAGGYPNARLCGDGSWPSESAKVQEVP